MFEERIAEMNRETETMQAHYAPEKRTYTVDEIQDILGISQPTAYALIKKNLFTVFALGGISGYRKPASTLGWTIRVNLSRMSRD